MAEGGSATLEEPIYYPPRLWGIDFQFCTFNKLYIVDILNMKPYPTHPGAFAYGNHPIFRVDTMGIVVRRDDRPKLYLYAVDDGTGVINCCCWKRRIYSGDAPQERDPSMSQLPAELHSMLLELEKERDTDMPGYELGDLVHIRGKLKLFRNMLEIVATYHRKIDDLNCQTQRMLEMPELYRRCYDKPFVLPPKVQQELAQGTLGKEHSTRSLREQIVDKIHELLQMKRMEEFSLSDLMKDADIVNFVKQLDTDRDGGDVLRQTLKWMEEVKGTVCCRRHVSLTYENLNRTSPLERRVVTLLKTECAKPKYAEKGCHYLHLHDLLIATMQYSTLHRTALLHVLERLETNSDVIRITDKCYMPM